MGRLDTRYAPVRRSPSIKASFDHAAPRLACVKPVASVHPEPGSNSSLYIFFFTFFIPRKEATEAFILTLIKLKSNLESTVRFSYLYYFLVYVNMSMN